MIAGGSEYATTPIGMGGFAAARALSLSTSCDLVAVSSLAVMAEQARGKLATEMSEARNTGIAGAPLLIVVDARRGEVYVQKFDNGGGDAVTGPLLLPIADATALAGPGTTLLAGSGAAAVAGAAGKAGKQVTAHLPDLLPDARDLCRLATTMDPTRGAIKPLYLRPANAKPQSGKSIERATP
jgi:tRNA threonylcarbamoyl adenosine modification protein YeaZ